MNSDIQGQVQLLLSIDAIAPDESVRIMSICSQVLNSSDYTMQLEKTLNPLLNQPNFDPIGEISQILIEIINLNQSVTYYKTISIQQMKYVIFGVLYYLLTKNPEIFKKLDLGLLRLSFDSSYKLLALVPENLQILEKTLIDSCLSILCCRPPKIHINKKSTTQK